MKLLKALTIIFFLTFFNSVAAQTSDPATTGAAFDSNKNIGEYIINYTLRGASFTNPEDTIFGALSGVLNGFMLFIALTVMAYQGGIWASATAAKGAPGGGKIEGGMVAFRNSIAVAMLAPVIANGFSPVQVFVKEAAETGAFIADSAVNAAQEYLGGYTGTGTHSITPTPLVNLNSVRSKVISAELCSQGYYIGNYSDFSRGLVGELTTFNIEKKGSSIVYSWGLNDYSSNVSYKDICGALELKIVDSLADRLEYSNGTFSLSQREEVETPTIFSRFIPEDTTIDRLEEMQFSTLQAQHNAVIEFAKSARRAIALSSTNILTDIISMQADKVPPEHDERFIDEGISQLVSASNRYSQSIRNSGIEAAKFVAETGPSNGSVTRWQNELEEKGFAALGAYYWVQQKSNARLMSLQEHLVNVHADEYDQVPISLTGVGDIFNGVWRKHSQKVLEGVSENFINDDFEISFSDSVIKKTGYSDYETRDENGNIFSGASVMVQKAINYFPEQILNAIERNLIDTTSNDIINKYVNLGVLLTNLAHMILVVIIGGALATAFGGPLVGLAVKGALVAAGDKVVGFLWFLFMFMIGMGLFLQYVLPAIPLYKWLISLHNWTLMLFLSFVYAPLWMLTLTFSRDGEWVSSHTQSGFLMILELLIRPFLMVAGFFAATILMLMANIGAEMMWAYLVGSGSEGVIGVFGIFAVLLISTYLVYRLIILTFDLIDYIGDTVLERLGAKLFSQKDDSTQGLMAIYKENIERNPISRITAGTFKK